MTDPSNPTNLPSISPLGDTSSPPTPPLSPANDLPPSPPVAPEAVNPLSPPPESLPPISPNPPFATTTNNLPYSPPSLPLAPENTSFPPPEGSQVPPLSIEQLSEPISPASIPEQTVPPPPPASDFELAADMSAGAGAAAEPPGKPRIQGSVFKFLIPILVGVILIGLLIFGITRLLKPKDKTSSEPPPINITYWGLWEEAPTIKTILAEYQTQNPGVTINYQQQSHKDYRERLQSSLAQGNGPDIFRFHNTWVPMLKNELAPVPSTMFDSTSFSTTFYPVMNQDLNLGGNILGIPLMIDGLGLYYNQKIFEAGGKTPPTDWAELRQTAHDLRVPKEGPIQTAGIALGTTGNVDHWPDIIAVMLMQNSADPANPTGTSAEDAIKFYTLFFTSDKVWDDTLPKSIQAFATEKVAMIFAPSWQAHTIKQINPNLEFGIVPIPQLPTSNTTWASYWVEGVSKKSQKQEEAFKVLKFLSEKDKLVKFYTEASKTRLFGEPYPRKDLADTLKSDPLVGAYVAQAENARSFYMASRTFDNGINDKIIKYYEDAINAVNQGEDVAEALQTTSQGIQQVLSQYGVTSNAQSSQSR